MRFGPSSYTTESREATRLFIETDAEGKALMKIRDQIMQRLSQMSLSTVSFSVASRELVMAEQSDALARGLLLSVGSALLLVAILILAVFRSISVMFVGLLPSILPIIAVFGGLGFLSGQVNMGTAMVAAVALGMISDNTFHFLVAWRFRDPGVSQTPLQLSSGPMIATALVLVGGFCPTILSSLPPMNQFGLLLSMCVALGLCGNLFLLPQLVSKHLKKAHHPRDTQMPIG
jgi:predicted RND superfamily exporter protein